MRPSDYWSCLGTLYFAARRRQTPRTFGFWDGWVQKVPTMLVAWGSLEWTDMREDGWERPGRWMGNTQVVHGCTV